MINEEKLMELISNSDLSDFWKVKGSVISFLKSDHPNIFLRRFHKGYFFKYDEGDELMEYYQGCFFKGKKFLLRFIIYVNEDGSLDGIRFLEYQYDTIVIVDD